MWKTTLKYKNLFSLTSEILASYLWVFAVFAVAKRDYGICHSWCYSCFHIWNMQYAYFFSVILFLASHYVIVTVNFYKFIMFIAASSVQFSKKVFFFIHGNRPLYPELSYKSCKYSFSCIFARFLIHLYFSFKQFAFINSIFSFCSDLRWMSYCPGMKGKEDNAFMQKVLKKACN